MCDPQATECTKTVAERMLEPLNDDERKAVFKLSDKLVAHAREGTLPAMFVG